MDIKYPYKEDYRMIKRWFMFMIMTLVSLVSFGCSSSNNDSSIADESVMENQIDYADQAVEEGYIYRHRDSASGGNDRESYIWEVMEAALQATVYDYGEYKIELVQDINQEREDYELYNDTGVITVISDSLNQNNIDNLSVIHFPVLRNILGYRVFLIDGGRQDEFNNIKTLDDLKPYQFGIGIGWNDKIVLEHSGLKVYEESEYSLLFKDVTTGVIDIFSRGVNEVVDEYDKYSLIYGNLKIEDNILLYYPLPRYYWFSKSPHGDMLRERLEIGLKRIEEDGTFYEIFDRYFAEDIKKLNLSDRVLIRLENPIYTDNFEKDDEEYRYDPLEGE